jgi:hypothetical protein
MPHSKVLRIDDMQEQNCASKMCLMILLLQQNILSKKIYIQRLLITV